MLMTEFRLNGSLVCTSKRYLPAHQRDDASSRGGFSHLPNPLEVMLKLTESMAEVIHIVLLAETRSSEDITPRKW